MDHRLLVLRRAHGRLRDLGRGDHAEAGGTGLRRDRVVTHSKIGRPDSKEYFGGHDAEGYAAPAGTAHD